MSGATRSNLGLAPRDMNSGVPISAANSSGPSFGVSSLVTDANSSISGGPLLQQSTSMNADSYMRLPASPMSFSSNNISGSSVLDGSSIVQQSPPQQQGHKRRSSSVTSQPVGEPGSGLHCQRKARIDTRQDDILQQQLIQQLLQGQSALHLQGQQNPQLQALLQQHKLAQIQQQQPHQLLQSFPQSQQAQIGITQQPQLRPQLTVPGMQPVGPLRAPAGSGLCSRRLMQYLYHKRHRPENNPISYWRKLVDEYYAPRARERWCVSSYEKRGNNSLGVSPQAASDTWRCDICGKIEGGKGYETTAEILPRLCQIRFDHGVIDEYLFLDMPHEYRMPNGLLVLEYKKVIQKSVYEHVHVTHEGALRIIFTPELKIVSWDFCAHRHEEYITRKLLTQQVSHLLKVAQKYQAAVTGSGPGGLSNNDAQAICNMFMTESRQLAKNLDANMLNEHGLSKRYLRCLQISEVVNNMKDLIGFSHKNKLGPVEGLKNYAKQAGNKLPGQNMHETKQHMGMAGLPTDQSALGKAVGPEMSGNMNNNFPGARAISNTPQNAAALSNYQSMLRSSSVNEGVLQQEASSAFKGPAPVHNAAQLGASRAFSGPNQGQSTQFQTAAPFQQPQLHNMPQHNNLQASGVNQQFEQHALQQLVHDLNGRSIPQQSPGTLNANSGITATSPASGEQQPPRLPQHMNNGPVKSTPPLGTGPSNVINSAASVVPSRSNSFKSVSSDPAGGGNAQTAKAGMQELDDLEALIASELAEGGLFIGGEQGGGGGAEGFSWDMN